MQPMQLHWAPRFWVTVVLGWGCKTSSLQTNCFVIDNIETQLTRHIALFHAIKENRSKLKLAVFFFNYNFTFCAILDKNCSKKLHVKIEEVAKSCNIKFLETAQNIELHIFWVFRKLFGSCKKKLQKLALLKCNTRTSWILRGYRPPMHGKMLALLYNSLSSHFNQHLWERRFFPETIATIFFLKRLIDSHLLWKGFSLVTATVCSSTLSRKPKSDHI